MGRVAESHKAPPHPQFRAETAAPMASTERTVGSDACIRCGEPSEDNWPTRPK